MRFRTTLLAAAVACLPALAFAQTTAPDATTPGAAPSATAPDAGGRPHHDRAFWKQRRAEQRAKYEQLSAADKAKFDDLTKQIRDLHHQRMQLLGISR